MTDPSIYDEFAKAIPVVIGGLLAVGGGFAGQFFTHRLTESREKAKLQRERLEALVKALYAHDQWLDAKRNTMIFRNEDHETPSPLDEARMLQALHFPELAQSLQAVQQAQIPMLKFIGEQRIARMKDQHAWIKEWSDAPYNEAYKLYLGAVGVVTTKCREMMYAAEN
ncbi:MAG TPA: hypothetical protein VIM35_06000 [Gallionella sp.]